MLATAACEHEAPVAASSRPEDLAAQPAVTEAPPAAGQKPAPPARNRKAGGKIEGRWVLRSGQQEYTLELVASDHGLRGYVYGPNGTAMPIKIGVYSGGAFLFETTGGDTGWLWSGHLATEGLTGQREHVQTGAVESFSARRLD